MPCPRNSVKKRKKVASEVIDSDTFLTYIWRGCIKHEFTNANTKEQEN